MLRALLRVILFAGFGCTVATCRASEEYLPQELYQLARQAGCGPVPGFFDRPGMIQPPYIYGYLPGPEENSAAFWCHEQSAKKNLMMFMYKGRLATFGTCPVYLELPGRFPGGLSLSKRRRIPLSHFSYLEHPEKKGPTGKSTAYAPLLEEFDGVGYLLYCHEGKWLYLLQH